MKATSARFSKETVYSGYIQFKPMQEKEMTRLFDDIISRGGEKLCDTIYEEYERLARGSEQNRRFRSAEGEKLFGLSVSGGKLEKENNGMVSIRLWLATDRADRGGKKFTVGHQKLHSYTKDLYVEFMCGDEVWCHRMDDGHFVEETIGPDAAQTAQEGAAA